MVDKPIEEMQSTDYKFTKVELGKQTFIGCQQDAQDAVAFLTQRNNKLWEKMDGLKEENACLLEAVEKMNNACQRVNPISTYFPKDTKRMKSKVKAIDDWYN